MNNLLYSSSRCKSGDLLLARRSVDATPSRGEHQQQNASLVYSLLNALTNKEYSQQIKMQLEGFHGIWRRMEEVATTEKGAKIFSDYGHVVSSLEVGLKALKEKFPEKKLICIFQPHQIHRILQGRNEFPEALKGYDERYIYNIYAARENFQKIVGTHQLGEIFAEHCESRYLKTFDEVENIIEKAGTNAIIMVYSAGDIDYALRKYLKVI